MGSDTVQVTTCATVTCGVCMVCENMRLHDQIATLETEREQKIRLAAGVVRVVCGLGSEPLSAREVDNVAEAIRKLAIKARDNRLAASQGGDGS